ncbi:unnamed protein product [Clavelina lepadiformis]|uniref:Cytochrome P450 n=1 Tax=Clavelina lepadiformis TaxID=159417 RepID=A0ABP0EW14_CLALP
MMLFELPTISLGSQNSFPTSGLLGSIFLLLITIYILWKLILPLRKEYGHSRNLDEIVGTDARHWFYGHLPKYGFDQKGVRNSVRRSSKFPVMFNKWFSPVNSSVQVYHPDSAMALLRSRATKDTLIYKFMRPWVGDGLLTSNGEKWHRHRRLLTPAFHFSVLQPYMKVSNECVQTFLGKMQEASGKPFELVENVSLLTLDVLMQCAMSAKTNCQNENNHPYIAAINDLSRHLFIRLENPLYLIGFIWNLSKPGRTFSKACDVVHSLAERVIAERREVLDKLHKETDKSQPEEIAKGIPTFKTRGKNKTLDFLDILLQTKDEDGNGLTDKEIRDQVDTFLFGGHDTTASAISWTLYNLAKYPKYQENCREEVNEVLKDNQDVEWDDLSKLSYLTMCLKESMRMNPPIPMVARRLVEPLTIRSKDHKIEQVTIPAETYSAMDIFALHKNPNVWENPEVFDPERFSRENSKKRSPHAFLPFSAGSRNCIGQNFAMNEVKVVLSHILRNYVLYLDDQTPEPIMQASAVLRSINGIFIKFQPVHEID